MLVLSRKLNEEVVINGADGPIHIVVVDIRGDKVRLGFECEKKSPIVPIHRREVYDAIQREQQKEKEGA